MTPADVLSEFYVLDAAVSLARDPISACWASDARYAFADEHGLSDGEGNVNYEAVEDLHESVYGVEMRWAA